jgi:hypothetical protein
VSSTPLAGIDGELREWLHPKRAIAVCKNAMAIFRSKFIFRPVRKLSLVTLLAHNMSQNKTGFPAAIEYLPADNAIFIDRDPAIPEKMLRDWGHATATWVMVAPRKVADQPMRLPQC